ncbi:MAG: DJ-1/PfpI family protein [Oscillospiraceae bacterium]
MVYVFLADGFEEVEAITPIDYLRRCEIDVTIVGVTGKIVVGAHNISILADATIYDVDYSKIEMIILPGGMPGTLNLEKNSKVRDIIKYCNENNKIIGAICAAPSILGHLGILNGKKATCYDGFSQELIGAEYINSSVVVDDNIITSQGAGTANQFAFELAKLLSKNADKLKSSVLWK